VAPFTYLFYGGSESVLTSDNEGSDNSIGNSGSDNLVPDNLGNSYRALIFFAYYITGTVGQVIGTKGGSNSRYHIYKDGGSLS
jgi:hypothetical protein